MSECTFLSNSSDLVSAFVNHCIFRYDSCPFPVLSIIVVVVDRFYIALFSALKQTHCARM